MCLLLTPHVSYSWLKCYFSLEKKKSIFLFYQFLRAQFYLYIPWKLSFFVMLVEESVSLLVKHPCHDISVLLKCS